MTIEAEERPARKPRADAQRNRERLVDAAKAAFAESGAEVSLEEIARRAGVGIGTLYRHFPTREAVVAAVYQREVQQIADAAKRLLASEAPGEALHEWMRLFVDYIATKKVIVSAFGSIPAGAKGLYPSSGLKLIDGVALLVERARAAGDIRADADPNDILRALIGFTYGAAGAGWEASALRLIDILMDGLRTPGRER
ncbi:MAG TPA: TetR/AcrR family transcriptional regulator [Caulobacteraceae bacterium]|nr:TetR/AcrR family transcriptional regulator [Caulobacteraceae bacterium]